MTHTTLRLTDVQPVPLELPEEIKRAYELRDEIRAHVVETMKIPEWMIGDERFNEAVYKMRREIELTIVRECRLINKIIGDWYALQPPKFIARIA